MEVNLLDLREFIKTGARTLSKYIIEEMFDMHSRVSQTVWDRKMFDDELERKGSGFIICYSGGSGENTTKSAGEAYAGRIVSSSGECLDIRPDMTFDLHSNIIGFFIFYNVIDEMHILDITVAADMQSKGIGSLMMGYVINKYGSIGVKYFLLETRVSNTRAINLYEKFGFKIFMSRKCYYDDNGEDALCMVKKL
mgnify:CR=1 FL=1